MSSRKQSDILGRHYWLSPEMTSSLHLRNERRNSILMTRHYPDLGSASDWLKEISYAARPIRITTQTFMAFLRRRFNGEPVVVSRNVGCFLRLSINFAGHSFQLPWNYPGGYSWEFLVGVCHPVLHILALFQTKECHFPHQFSDQTSKNPYPFSDLGLFSSKAPRTEFSVPKTYIMFAAFAFMTKVSIILIMMQ